MTKRMLKNFLDITMTTLLATIAAPTLTVLTAPTSSTTISASANQYNTLTSEENPINTPKTTIPNAEDTANTPTPPSTTYTSKDLLGTWTGTYKGLHSDTFVDRDIKLYIYDINNDHFYGYAEINSNKFGSYFFEGIINNNQVSFTGTEWYENVFGASFNDFSGIINNSNNSFSILGTVDNNSDRPFSLIKESSQPTNPRHLPADSIELDWTGYYDGHTYYENTRRTMDLHISKISADGSITGTVSIDKYTGEENYVTGTYRITGKYEDDKGLLTFQGTDWVNIPIGAKTDEFTFIEFKGYVNPENKTICGNTENGIWSVTPIDYSDEASQLDNFVLGRDNNSYTNSNAEKTDGFYGLSSFPIDENALINVCKRASLGEKASIKRYVTDAETWSGSCYGMASTMALAHSKTLPLSSLGYADTYFGLQKPCENEKLLKMVDYYHILQYIDNDEISISKTYRDSTLLDKLSNWFSDSDSLATFLKKMVEAAREKRVMVFSFVFEERGGHAVLLTGYEYDQVNECYKLQVYDENSVHSGNIIGSFSYMTIPKDFSSFEYTDANGEVISSDNFSELWLQDINLWNADILKTKKIQKFQELQESEDSGVGSNDTTLVFKKGCQVSVKNEAGEVISYNCKEFSGDMGIHGTKYIFGDDKYLFDVDNAEKYIVNGDGVTIYNDKMYSSVTGSGLGNITIDDMGNVLISRSDSDVNGDANFTVYTTNEQADGNLYKVSGQISGTAQISLDEGGLEISKISTETATNTELRNITGCVIDNRNVMHNFTVDKVTDEGLSLTIDRNDIAIEQGGSNSGDDSCTSPNTPSPAPDLSPKTTAITTPIPTPTTLPTSSIPPESPAPPAPITPELAPTTTTPQASSTSQIPTANNEATKIHADKNGILSTIRPPIKSIRASKKQLVITCKRIKGVSGYHIQCSTEKKFGRNVKNKYSRGSNESKGNIIKVKLGGLKTKKKYYVRARVYVIADGKKCFGEWSRAKSKKVK